MSEDKKWQTNWPQWIAADGSVCIITIQGKLLMWKIHKSLPETKPKEKGTTINTFSPAARLRMFKYMNTIDWQQARPCVFITLTLPDECLTGSIKEMTTRRWVFWRYLETSQERRIASLWRTEWVVRQSGIYQGQLAPHQHFIVFNTSYVDQWAVKEWWKKTLAYDGTVITDVEPLDTERKACIYIAKYCAKLPVFDLDIALYLNKPIGRHWGKMRADLIPICPKMEYRATPGAVLEELRTKAIQGKKHIDPNDWESFTIFGDRVTEVYELLRSYGFAFGDNVE